MKTQSKAQHTPTPWKIWDMSSRDIEDSNGNLISTAYPDEKDPSYTSEIAKANAAYIVRSVNSHEELIKALKAQMSWRMRDGSLCTCPAGKDEDEPKGKMPVLHSTGCEIARDALRLAEAE